MQICATRPHIGSPYWPAVVPPPPPPPSILHSHIETQPSITDPTGTISIYS